MLGKSQFCPLLSTWGFPPWRPVPGHRPCSAHAVSLPPQRPWNQRHLRGELEGSGVGRVREEAGLQQGDGAGAPGSKAKLLPPLQATEGPGSCLPASALGPWLSRVPVGSLTRPRSLPVSCPWASASERTTDTQADV